MQETNNSKLHTLNNNGVRLFKCNQFDKAIDIFHLADKCTVGSMEKHSQNINSSLSKRKIVNLSSLKYIMEKAEKAHSNSSHKLIQSSLDEGFNTFTEVFEIDEDSSCKSPTILYNIGKTYQNMGNYKDALCSYYNAINKADNMGVSNQTDLYILLAILHSVGQVHYFNGQLETSLSAYSIAVDVAKENMGYTNLITASSLNCIGVLKYHLHHESEPITKLLEESHRLRSLLCGSRHKDVATTLNNLGRLYFKQGNYSKAICAYKEALSIRTSTFGDNHLDVAATYFNLGEAYRFGHISDLSNFCYMEFLRICQLKDLWNDSEVAYVLITLGENFQNSNNNKEAIPFFKRALIIQINIFGENNEQVARTLNKLGNLYFEDGNYAAAVKQYQKELLIELELYGMCNCNVVHTLINIAESYKKKKDYEQSLCTFKHALEIQNKILNINNTEKFITMCSIGYLYHQMRDFPEALKVYHSALKIRLKNNDKGDIESASILTQLGLILLKMNEWKPALRAFHKSLRIQKSISINNCREIAHNLYNIAVITYQNACDAKKALKYFERALKIEVEILGFAHSDVASTLFHMGQIHLQLGNLDEALKNFKQAFNIQRNSNGENDIAVAEILSSIGEVYAQRGDIHKSMQIFIEVSRIYREAGENGRNSSTLPSEFYFHKYYSEEISSIIPHAAAA